MVVRDGKGYIDLKSLTLAVLLLFAALSPLSLAQLEENTDLQGMDYKNFDLSSPDPNLCAQECYNDSQCKAFTYVKPGCQGPNARCWLKNGVPAATSNECAISGVKANAQTGALLPLSPENQTSNSEAQAVMGPGGSSGEGGVSGAFLYLENIPGESKEVKHSGWIDVISFNYSIANPSPGSVSSGGASGAGRAEFGDLILTKYWDKSSPKIYQLTSIGKHIPEARLELLNAGRMVLQYKLTDVVVVSVQVEGTEADKGKAPLEKVALGYSKIEWTYPVTDLRGASMGVVKTGWDVATNKAI